VKVKWPEFIRYTSSTETSMPAGEGELYQYIYGNGEAIAIVIYKNGFIEVPRVYLTIAQGEK